MAHPVNMAARSASGVTLAHLKRGVNLAARDFHSKYRHKGRFRNSLGRGSLSHLPVWAVALIFVAIVLAVFFIAGLIFFGEKGKQNEPCLKRSRLTRTERRRAAKSGTPIQWKQVLWNATKYAFFLWIPIYIYNAIKHRSIKGKGKTGSYAEIQEDQQRLNNPQVTETRPWNASNAPASDDAKFEPMGYKSQIYDPYSAYAGVDQSAVGVTSAQPSPSLRGPNVAPSPPTTAGLHQPPPPLESGDLATRSPSPHRASFASPSQPPPSYRHD